MHECNPITFNPLSEYKIYVENHTTALLRDSSHNPPHMLLGLAFISLALPSHRLVPMQAHTQKDIEQVAGTRPPHSCYHVQPNALTLFLLALLAVYYFQQEMVLRPSHEQVPHGKRLAHCIAGSTWGKVNTNHI